MAIYQNPAQPISGAVADNGDSIAIARSQTATNIVVNPSFVDDLTGYSYSLGGSAPTVYTNDCYRSGHSCKLVGDGATNECDLYTTVNLAAGQAYTASVYVKARGGASLTLCFRSSVGVVVSPVPTFEATGRWQRLSISWISTGSTVFQVYLGHSLTATAGALVYTDCWQVEFGGVATTYVDGDQYGCRWDGRPHASSSVRSTFSNRGGVVTPLSRYGFRVTGMAGLGLQVNPIGSTYGLVSGGFFERSITSGYREFQIAGTISAKDARELRTKRQGLIDLLRPSQLGGIQQPITLLLNPADFEADYRNVDPVSVQSVYTGGLDDTPVHAGTQNVVLSFRAYDPVEFVTLKEDCVELSLGTSPDANQMNLAALRSGNGEWELFGGGVDATLYVIKKGDDGYIYAGGTHPTNGRKGVMRWDGTQWNILGTAGFNGFVHDLAWDASGNLYAVGAFTGNTNGTELYARIALWDGSTWAALGSGLNGTARTVMIGSQGYIYVGGDFTTAGGSSANRIAYWDGSTWATLGTGLDGSVYALVEKSSIIYAGGNFTTAGGSSADNIAQWTGSAWATVGAGASVDGVNDTVRSMVLGQDGIVYVGGDFTACGDISANRLASWNGGQYAEVGGGTNGIVRGVAVGRFGSLYICGDFTAVNGLAIPYLAHWSGTVWLPIEGYAGTTVTAGGESISYTSGDELIVTVNGRLEHISDVTTATVLGSAATFPVLRIVGPGTLHNLTNWQTRTAIFFDLTLQAGEVALLRLEPSNLTFTSNIRGNIIGTIRPGSHIGQLSLVPGTNSLSCLMYDTTAASEVEIYWRTRFASTDGT